VCEVDRIQLFLQTLHLFYDNSEEKTKNSLQEIAQGKNFLTHIEKKRLKITENYVKITSFFRHFLIIKRDFNYSFNSILTDVFFLFPLSRYSRFSTTLGSFNGGYGNPMTSTALALASVKSKPSDTFPRQTASKLAPRSLTIL